jgi:site-specific recombinase XerD
MRRSAPTDLGRNLVRFFEDFLPAQRGLSPHTIRSYRDALVLLLQFVARDAQRGIEQLTIRDLSAERVTQFLRFLETDRKNGIATRNARLGSIHVFARFLATHHPEQLGSLQRVIGIPFKHGARDAPIE